MERWLVVQSVEVWDTVSRIVQSWTRTFNVPWLDIREEEVEMVVDIRKKGKQRERKKTRKSEKKESSQLSDLTSIRGSSSILPPSSCLDFVLYSVFCCQFVTLLSFGRIDETDVTKRSSMLPPGTAEGRLFTIFETLHSSPKVINNFPSSPLLLHSSEFP